MKKILIGATATALLIVGVASPANAAVTIHAPIVTAEGGFYSFVAVSGDGSLVASVSQISVTGATIYEVASGDTRFIDINSTNIGEPSFSPDNALFYVPDIDNGVVVVLDLADDSVDRIIDINDAAFNTAISPDGNTLYVGALGDVYKIDLTDDSISSSVNAGSAAVTSMCISADGSMLYYPGVEDDVISAIDTSDWQITDTWNTGTSSLPQSCQIDNDGNIVVSTLSTSEVIKFDPDGNELARVTIEGSAYDAVPGCDGIYVANQELRNTIEILNAATLVEGEPISPDETIGGEGFFGNSAARNLDGTVLAIGGYYGIDGLVVITCDAPALPNTGVDVAATVAVGGLASVAVVAGAIALVIRRRRV